MNRRAILLLCLALGAGLSSPGLGAEAVRKPCVAGKWYEASLTGLTKQVDGFLATAPKVKVRGRVLALVSPHAGFAFSGKAAAAGFALLKGRKISRVIILAFSHRYEISGVSVSKDTWYETPLGRVAIDREVCDALLKKDLFSHHRPAHQSDWSDEAQVPFLQRVLTEFKIVPLLVGRGLTRDQYAKVAESIRPFINNETVIVASSDFTHFGRRFHYAPVRDDLKTKIRELDLGAVDRILGLDFDGFQAYVKTTGATICGRHPIAVLLRLLPPNAQGALLRYYTSGDVVGRYGDTVSYCSIVFTEGGVEGGEAIEGTLSARARKKLLEIARQAMTAAVNRDPLPAVKIEDAALRKELSVARGCFVTLKNRGRLRGCLGVFRTKDRVDVTVADRARASAVLDYRFAADPIRAAELEDIEIEISILSPLRKLTTPTDFIPGVHGVLVQRGRRGGTYLPQVAIELGARTPQAFLRHLCARKAGLEADAWSDELTDVFIYSAQVFHETKGAAE